MLKIPESIDAIINTYSDHVDIENDDVQVREHHNAEGQLVAVTLSHHTADRIRDRPKKYGWIETTDRGFIELGDPDLYEANDGSYHHLDDMIDWPEEVLMEYLVQACEDFGWREAHEQAPDGWSVDSAGVVSRP